MGSEMGKSWSKTCRDSITVGEAGRKPSLPMSAKPRASILPPSVQMDEELVQRLMLSDQQKDYVVTTWKLLEENIAKVGVITFLRLFETHPDVQSVFLPFAGLDQDQLRNSKQLQTHALKVMNFIQKVIARINEPAKIYALLYQLGKNHVSYGAKQQYIELVGPQFVFTIKPTLDEIWSTEIEEAWLHLFDSMSQVMKLAMDDANNSKGYELPPCKE